MRVRRVKADAGLRIPDDVVKWIGAHFPQSECRAALEALAAAVDHAGQSPAPRLVRCAAMASRGRLDQLLEYVRLLRIDYRDVIVAGEYEIRGEELVRVRDLNQPIADV